MEFGEDFIVKSVSSVFGAMYEKVLIGSLDVVEVTVWGFDYSLSMQKWFIERVVSQFQNRIPTAVKVAIEKEFMERELLVYRFISS